MERILPTYKIEDTTFIVDVAKSELRQLDNPANTIAFDDMKDKGVHYSMYYDKIAKEIRPPIGAKDKNVIEVKVPPMALLDPAGMAEKHGLSVEELKGKSDFEIIVDQQLLAKRLNGILPKINIAGHNFIVDLRLNELRPENDFSTRIDLKNLDVSNDGEHFLCFYNPTTKRVVEVDPKIIALPKDVVMLKIPNELILDPVGVARGYGLEDTAMLRRFPIQKNLKADVVVLSETGLPKMIKENKAKINKQFNPPRLIKRKRGRRL